ncbi:ECs_2282 family putative zinc-binding protein [Acinetobacter variabilis]|uniref:ECs_2282 family putative zinc-binding protein n=1 Tax=Acinetobacter variabilis TaxID=70346 RepID=UPI0028AE5BD2|nr:hypothetical protein [Acinetobacter variabilis]
MKFQEQNRIVEMNCPVCADNMFQHNEDENSLIVCNSCSTEFTRDELKEANTENIKQHKKEMVDKAINEVKKQFQKNIKNIFKNSKNFKVK